MSATVHVRGSIIIPVTELQWRFPRASGPAGQNVNKASTAVELSFDLAASTAIPEPLKSRALDRLADRLVEDVITIRADENHSQWRNRQIPLRSLRPSRNTPARPLPTAGAPTQARRLIRQGHSDD